MEEQQSSGRGSRKAASTESKQFGTIGENEASFLVGSIVEKGDFSSPNNASPTPLPKPTVLPFPVPRHRSHGPHWDPIGTRKDSMEDREQGAHDDKDNAEFTEINSIAAFAKPIHRKEKKGLDLSMWKELTQSHDSSMTKEKGGVKLCWTEKAEKNGREIGIAGKKSTSSDPSVGSENVLAGMEVDGRWNLDSSGPLPRTEEAVTSSSGSSFITGRGLDKSYPLSLHQTARDDSQGGLKNEPMANLMFHRDIAEKQLISETPTVPTKFNVMDEPVPTSLEDEIDAENRARLQSMSTEEIAQANAEIMERMDPALLELLRKRGHEKLKRKRLSSYNQVMNGELNLAENKSVTSSGTGSLNMESNKPQVVATNTPNDGKSDLNSGEGKNLVPQSNSYWNTWTERVEAIRRFRFSLDGTVVEKDHAQIPEMTSEAPVLKIATVDSVAERDILRTEGDPGAAGYTIKEAVALTRSVVSGQRILALNLLASILDKAIQNIGKKKIGYTLNTCDRDAKAVDWEAVWSYALGPEPELVLSLRLSLDDNNDAVVLACARLIQRVLNYDLNESFFDMSEKTGMYRKAIYSAPVFRSKPGIDVGFLRGGFWKYNVKPSNILPVADVVDDDTEGKHTIQDDLFVAEQDFVAGLVRMGILLNIRYHLEMELTVLLEECLISILVAIARHSPTCANAILKCQRLVEHVVQRFTQNNDMECYPSKIKTVRLLRVLAQSEKRNCLKLIEDRSFHAVTWNLYQNPSFLDQLLKLGREKFKLLSSLTVEQLRFWKVCIQNGYCVSDFSHIFPALCLWLTPPSFEKLLESDLLTDFASVSREAYLVLEELAGRLPNFWSQNFPSDETQESANESAENWSWSHVGPMIDLAMKWVLLKTTIFNSKNQIRENVLFHDSSLASLLWVFSAVLGMLHTVLQRVTPEEKNVKSIPWLPEFVPRMGLEIIRSGFLSSAGVDSLSYGKNLSGSTSFMEELCCLRQQRELDVALASACCVHHLLKVVTSVNSLIQLARAGTSLPSSGSSFLREDNILAGGILENSLAEFRCLFDVFDKLVISEWGGLQCVETFGRGGPAPGVGVGWGASGGGFWSITSVLAQTDSRLLIQLLEIFQVVSVDALSGDEQRTFNVRKVSSALRLCLVAGPRDREVVEKAVDFMLQVPSLNVLDLCISHLLQSSKRFTLFRWKYGEEEYVLMSNNLASHFRNRWLSKKKSRAISGNRTSNGSVSLETIPEDLDTTSVAIENHYCTYLTLEWAHQRLPLPNHWFLSPISTLCDSKNTAFGRASDLQNLVQDPNGAIEVAKAGLFFLLGIEAVPFFLTSDMTSPAHNVPLVWKVHSLSVILLVGMDVLEEDRSRDVYKSLQEFYGQRLDEVWSERVLKITSKKSLDLPAEGAKDHDLEFLAFQSVIHESYTTFIETLVEQYAAVSYGDLLYGRQVALYLHRCTESPLRLAAWKTLSNAHVLELLPPIEKCYGEAEGYLEPVEENESILEAYMNSWVSGALDKAAALRSMAFALVLHHLSSFIFFTSSEDKLTLRNKLAKHLLRDYSRKSQHEGMMLKFIQYEKLCPTEQTRGILLHKSKMDERFEVLKEACEGNSSLLSTVENLRSSSLI